MKKDAWFRLYTSVLDPLDPSRVLSDRLHRQWIYTQAAYRRSEGVMPDLPVLAAVLGVTPAECKKVLEALYKAELLDRVNDAWVPTGWDSLQFENDSSKERTRRYRQRHAERQVGVTGDAPVTSQAASRNGPGDVPVTSQAASQMDVSDGSVTSQPSGFSEFRVQSSEFSSGGEEGSRLVTPPPPRNGTEQTANGTQAWWEAHWKSVAEGLMLIRRWAGNPQNGPPRTPDREICLEVGSCFESYRDFAEWVNEKGLAKQGADARNWSWFRKLARAEGTRRSVDHPAIPGGSDAGV